MGNTEKPRKVLLVDDEADILELLEYNLLKEGYQVRTANNGKTALEVGKEFKPDLILLDIMMPGIDGVETCRLFREDNTFQDTYIIFLTARSEEYSEVAAFQNGANDYLVKPIKPRALMSRIDAFFRRSAEKVQEEDEVKILDLEINRSSYTIQKNGVEITFPRKEFELLYFLAKNPRKVYNREDLLERIWGADVSVIPRTVDVHIRKIREKLGEGYIKTVKGVGYKFDL
ncbi:MAG: response regulator transcription factor [Cytophagales bacterium]|nr:response regulator transcription factor [Cytophagales bacterium]